jgi:hypothetical protein
MGLSEQDIDEFIQLYREDRGEDISREKAREEASRLFLLFGAIYRPIPKG